MSSKRISNVACAAAGILLILISLFVLMFQVLYALKGLNIVIPDGYVFKYIGIRMTMGEMPYRDIFDHKGPLLYLINYCGALIDHTYGIVVIESLFNICSSLLLVLIPIRLGCSKIKSLFIVFVAMLFYISVFAPGNYVEEFALPFILAGYLIFIDYFEHGIVSSLRLIVLGLCFGAVMMLRPNMAGLWVVFCIAVLVRCIKDKKQDQLPGFILKFLAGCLIVVLPLVLWLYANDSLEPFWQQYIVFNLKYSNSDAILRSIAMVDMLKKPYTIAVFVISVIFVFVSYRQDKKIPNLFFPFAFYFIFQSVMLVIAGTSYQHYFIVAVPFILYPLAGLSCCFSGRKHEVLINSLIIILSVLVLLSGLELPYKRMRKYFAGGYDVPSELTELVDTVKGSSEHDDTLTMFGNWDYIYIATGLRSATRYTYAKPVIYLDEEIFADYFNDLEKYPPDILVLEFTNDEIESFIKDNSYCIIYESENYSAYKKGE